MQCSEKWSNLKGEIPQASQASPGVSPEVKQSWGSRVRSQNLTFWGVYFSLVLDAERPLKFQGTCFVSKQKEKIKGEAWRKDSCRQGSQGSEMEKEKWAVREVEGFIWCLASTVTLCMSTGQYLWGKLSEGGILRQWKSACSVRDVGRMQPIAQVIPAC